MGNELKAAYYCALVVICLIIRFILSDFDQFLSLVTNVLDQLVRQGLQIQGEKRDSLGLLFSRKIEIMTWPVNL